MLTRLLFFLLAFVLFCLGRQSLGMMPASAVVAEDVTMIKVTAETSTGERIAYDPQPKGDYAANYEAIYPADGRTVAQKAAAAGFTRKGNKLVKSYGSRSPPAETVAGTDAFTFSDPAVFQARVEEAIAAKTPVTVFRQGTFADEAIGWEGNYIKGKQWATDNPLTTPNYAKRYGLPAENTGKPDWVVGGRTQGPYTTRPAPASHNNPLNTGGATEVLPQNPNDVILDWFHMP